MFNFKVKLGKVKLGAIMYNILLGVVAWNCRFNKRDQVFNQRLAGGFVLSEETNKFLLEEKSFMVGEQRSFTIP